MEYYYELFNERNVGGGWRINAVTCRVFNLDETQIEVFDFMITKEKEYMAWTCDTISQITINRRKEIEKELNKSVIDKAV